MKASDVITQVTNWSVCIADLAELIDYNLSTSVGLAPFDDGDLIAVNELDNGIEELNVRNSALVQVHEFINEDGTFKPFSLNLVLDYMCFNNIIPFGNYRIDCRW